MSTAYTAHVTLDDGTIRRVSVAAAPSRERAAEVAMAGFCGRGKFANAWPAERATATIDCRVSLTTPVKHSDSEFGELLA